MLGEKTTAFYISVFLKKIFLSGILLHRMDYKSIVRLAGTCKMLRHLTQVNNAVLLLLD